MDDAVHLPTVHIAGRPVYPMLVHFPVACFIGTLLTDITYWRTAEMMWADFSAWLLAVGVVLGVLAAVVGLIDLFADRRFRGHGAAWLYAAGNLLALVLSFFNLLVHSRDAWTSVVPTGLTLSAVVTVILVLTGWVGWPAGYRYGLGVVR
jgi:uncharacterized membrane protein